MRKGAGIETRLNMNGATPFLMAARTADAELMRLFLELGANPMLPNANNTTPLLVAAGIGTIRAGVDPGTESEVLEAVKIAFELGGDVNAVDDNGETAMHGAAYKEAPSVVRFLVDKGANVAVWNRKNRLGETPLKISQGVLRGDNIRYRSSEMAAALRQVMSEAGVSTVLEP
jgi:ankyrin repeat protein